MAKLVLYLSQEEIDYIVSRLPVEPSYGDATGVDIRTKLVMQTDPSNQMDVVAEAVKVYVGWEKK